jgi:hypothetical protein
MGRLVSGVEIEINTTTLAALVNQMRDAASNEILSILAGLGMTAIDSLWTLGFEFHDATVLDGDFFEAGLRVGATTTALLEAVGVLELYLVAVDANESGNSTLASWALGGSEFIGNAAQTTDFLIAAPVETVVLDPNATTVNIQDYDVSIGGGEVIVGGAEVHFTLQTLSNGQVILTEQVTANGGAGVKIGVSGEVGGFVQTTKSWNLANATDASTLMKQLMTVQGLGLVGAGLAKMYFQLPSSDSTTVEGGAIIAAGAGFATLQASGSATAGVETTTVGSSSSTALNVDLSGDASINMASVGVYGAADINANLSATVTLQNGQPSTVELSGSFQATGSLTVNGQSFTAGPGAAIRVDVSASVDLNSASAQVKLAFADLNSNDPAAAAQAVKTLIDNGIHVKYDVFEGTGQDGSLTFPVFSGREDYDNLNYLTSGQFNI